MNKLVPYDYKHNRVIGSLYFTRIEERIELAPDVKKALGTSVALLVVHSLFKNLPY